MADLVFSVSVSDPASTVAVYLNGAVILAGPGSYTSPEPLVAGQAYVFQFYVEAPRWAGTDYTVEVTAPIARHISVSLPQGEKDFGGFRFSV